MTGGEMRAVLTAALAEVPELDAEFVADRILPTVRGIVAGEMRALRARLAACEDAPTNAALEGLDFTLRVLAHQADALDPTCPRCATPYPGACQRSTCPRAALDPS